MRLISNRQFLPDWSNYTIEEKEKFLGYALLAPSLVLVGLVIIYPLLYNIYLSFTTVPLNPSKPVEWVGLQNYAQLVTTSAFWDAFKTTILFTAFADILATIAGLAVAILLQQEFSGRRFARGLVLLPYVLPIIAGAFVWRWMFNPLYGIGTNVLGDIGLVPPHSDLLSNPETALPMLILFDTWKYFPFAFLIINARLQAVPVEKYEAAKIDGASRLARFKDITLPELKFAIGTVFLLRWIWNFNKYADIWLLTHDVTTLSVFTYQSAFVNYDQGQASAIAMLLFVFLIAFVLVYVGTVLDW